MAKKAALGRGLGALLESSDTDSPDSPGAFDIQNRARESARIFEIDVTNITANPYQPRTTFAEAGLAELAESIKQHGIIQPVTVKDVGGGRYQLISGERRLRASKLAGLRRIPSYVRDATSESMLEMAIVENIQREELDPIEVALGYQQLMEECELTQEDVATKIGKNRSTVSNALRLLKLPPTIQLSLRTGDISAGHARALINLPDTKQQLTMLAAIREESLSVRQVEKRVRAILDPPKSNPPTKKAKAESTRSSRDSDIAYLTGQLRKKFSTKIEIRRSSDGKGRIELEFYDSNDLSRLVELLLDQ